MLLINLIISLVGLVLYNFENSGYFWTLYFFAMIFLRYLINFNKILAAAGFVAAIFWLGGSRLLVPGVFGTMEFITINFILISIICSFSIICNIKNKSYKNSFVIFLSEVFFTLIIIYYLLFENGFSLITTASNVLVLSFMIGSITEFVIRTIFANIIMVRVLSIDSDNPIYTFAGLSRTVYFSFVYSISYASSFKNKLPAIITREKEMFISESKLFASYFKALLLGNEMSKKRSKNKWINFCEIAVDHLKNPS